MTEKRDGTSEIQKEGLTKEKRNQGATRLSLEGFTRLKKRPAEEKKPNAKREVTHRTEEKRAKKKTWGIRRTDPRKGSYHTMLEKQRARRD